MKIQFKVQFQNECKIHENIVSQQKQMIQASLIDDVQCQIPPTTMLCVKCKKCTSQNLELNDE